MTWPARTRQLRLCSLPPCLPGSHASRSARSQPAGWAWQTIWSVSAQDRQPDLRDLRAGEVPKPKGKPAAAHPAPAGPPEPSMQAQEVLASWQPQAAALSNAGTPHSKAVLVRLGGLLQQQGQVSYALALARVQVHSRPA